MIWRWFKGELILVERDLLERIEEEMDGIEDTKCDHSVGICWCSWNSTVDRLRELLT